MDLPLLLGIGVYFVSSIAGVSVVKLMNYNFCLTSWWIFAMLSRSTLVFSAIFHLILKYREGVSTPSTLSGRQFRLYCAIATGLSMVEAVNSFTMSILPGSLYMLLKGSDVGWSMILSCLVLKKKYSVMKIAGAFLIMLGVGTVLLLDVIGGSGNISSDRSDDDTSISTKTDVVSATTAAMLCLGGALLNSLCSVGTEATLKQSLREEEEKLLNIHTQQQQQQHSTVAPSPSKLLLSNMYSMYTSLFSFVMLVPLTLLRDSDHEERRRLSTNENINSTMTCEATMLNDNNIDGTDQSTYIARVIIGLCLASLAISRFLERLCKHFICVYDSAVTFSIVQAARRWLGIYLVGLIFQEDFANGMILGSLVSGVGFVLHGYDALRIVPAYKMPRDYKKLASNLSDANDVASDNSVLGEIELQEESFCNNKARIKQA